MGAVGVTSTYPGDICGWRSIAGVSVWELGGRKKNGTTSCEVVLYVLHPPHDHPKTILRPPPPLHACALRTPLTHPPSTLLPPLIHTKTTLSYLHNHTRTRHHPQTIHSSSPLLILTALFLTDTKYCCNLQSLKSGRHSLWWKKKPQGLLLPATGRSSCPSRPTATLRNDEECLRPSPTLRPPR